MCYCDICQKNSLSALVNKTRKVKVWGEEITVMYRTEVCGFCGSERYNEKVELAILKKAVALYREKKQFASFEGRSHSQKQLILRKNALLRR